MTIAGIVLGLVGALGAVLWAWRYADLAMLSALMAGAGAWMLWGGRRGDLGWTKFRGSRP